MVETELSLNLPTFTFSQMKEFLINRGWNIKENGPNSILCSSPKDISGKRLTYLVPDDQSQDFRQLAVNTLKGVSVVEKTNFGSVLTEFRAYLERALTVFQSNMKLKFGDATSNSISLQESELISKHSRLALAHAIDCELAPISFRKKASHRASNMSEDFFVGHQKGSYIFVISSPFSSIPEQQDLPGIPRLPSLYIRSMLRIAKGLQWIHANGSLLNDYDALSQASIEGLNANMAGHLADLFRSVSARDKFFIFNFNSDLVQSQNLSSLSYAVGAKQIEEFDQIYQTLSGWREESHTVQVKVVNLNSKDPQVEHIRHKIGVTIIGAGSPFKGRHLSFELPKDLYSNAIAAHKSATPMNLEGRFEVRGTEIRLIDIVKFT